jgi:hypothetical protein
VRRAFLLLTIPLSCGGSPPQHQHQLASAGLAAAVIDAAAEPLPNQYVVRATRGSR